MRKLWMNVILQALEDLKIKEQKKAPPKRNEEIREIRNSAEAFFFSQAHRPRLEEICTFAEVPADRVISFAREYMKTSKKILRAA